METRQLTRSETNKRIAGVCGGIGEYFGIDPVLVRIGFVVAGIMFWGILLYVVLWVVLPRGQPGNGATPAAGSPSSPAVRIAEDRYARGEITAEQLHQIRGDLARGS